MKLPCSLKLWESSHFRINSFSVSLPYCRNEAKTKQNTKEKNAGTQLWCHCHATKAWLHASYRLQIALDACVIFCYMHSHTLPPSLHQHADAAFKKTQDCAPRYLVTMPTICLTYCSWQDNEGLSRWVEANLTLIQECETFLLRKRTVY